MNFGFKIVYLSYLSLNHPNLVRPKIDFANLREKKHPNVYVESPVLKGVFFSILGGLSMVMDSQGGEMTPGKKIRSKS